jgi:hypothetical protein
MIDQLRALYERDLAEEIPDTLKDALRILGDMSPDLAAGSAGGRRGGGGTGAIFAASLSVSRMVHRGP